MSKPRMTTTIFKLNSILVYLRVIRVITITTSPSKNVSACSYPGLLDFRRLICSCFVLLQTLLYDFEYHLACSHFTHPDLPRVRTRKKKRNKRNQNQNTSIPFPSYPHTTASGWVHVAYGAWTPCIQQTHQKYVCVQKVVSVRHLRAGPRQIPYL